MFELDGCLYNACRESITFHCGVGREGWTEFTPDPETVYGGQSEPVILPESEFAYSDKLTRKIGTLNYILDLQQPSERTLDRLTELVNYPSAEEQKIALPNYLAPNSSSRLPIPFRYYIVPLATVAQAYLRKDPVLRQCLVPAVPVLDMRGMVTAYRRLIPAWLCFSPVVVD